MKRSTVYSGDVITFTFAAIPLDKGLGPDTFLEIEQEGENWTYTQGIDREGVFNHVPGGATRIKVTFLQTSEMNALLSAYHIASEAAGGLPAPIFYEDRKGTSKLVGASAVLTKLPPEKFGKEVDVVTWEFLVHDPVRTVGGH